MTKLSVTHNNIKDALRDLLINEPELFANIIKEVMQDADAAREKQRYISDKEVDQIMEEDFRKYDAVFRALA